MKKALLAAPDGSHDFGWLVVYRSGGGFWARQSQEMLRIRQ